MSIVGQPGCNCAAANRLMALRRRIPEASMEPVLGLRRSPRCGEASAGLCAFASGSKTLAIPVLLCTPLCPSYGTSTHFSVSLGLLQWCCLSADWLYLGAGASVYALNSRTPRSAARALRGAGPPQFAARGHAQTHAAAAAASAPNFAAPRRHNTDAPAAGVDSAKKRPRKPRRRRTKDGLLRRKFEGHGRRLVSR